MTSFTTANLVPWAGSHGIHASTQDLLHAPLPWQRRGLQQTRSGYGARLTSSFKISYNGRLYRLYHTCYSNNGTTWFKANGLTIFVI